MDTQTYKTTGTLLFLFCFVLSVLGREMRDVLYTDEEGE